MFSVGIFPAIRVRHRRCAGLGAASQDAGQNGTHFFDCHRARAEGGQSRTGPIKLKTRAPIPNRPKISSSQPVLTQCAFRIWIFFSLPNSALV